MHKFQSSNHTRRRRQCKAWPKLSLCRIISTMCAMRRCVVQLSSVQAHFGSRGGAAPVRGGFDVRLHAFGACARGLFVVGADESRSISGWERLCFGVGDTCLAAIFNTCLHWSERTLSRMAPAFSLITLLPLFVIRLSAPPSPNATVRCACRSHSRPANNF